MLPALRLASDKIEHKFRTAVDELAEEFVLTDEERNELLPSGSQAVLHNNVKIFKRSGGVFVNDRYEDHPYRWKSPFLVNG